LSFSNQLPSSTAPARFEFNSTQTHTSKEVRSLDFLPQPNNLPPVGMIETMLLEQHVSDFETQNMDYLEVESIKQLGAALFGDS